MLAQIMMFENMELEQQRASIVQANSDDQRKLKEIEEQILRSLQSNTNILEEESLIIKLTTSKATFQDIKQRLMKSKEMEKEINSTREAYRAGAFDASVLYFCIADLTKIDQMYQYSLQWFEKLFGISLKKAQAHTKVEKRLLHIKQHFTRFLYESVCSSLFGKHKLVFSFLLAIRLLISKEGIDKQKLAFFLKGPSQRLAVIPQPEALAFIEDNAWALTYQQLKELESFSGFFEFFSKFQKNNIFWKTFYFS